MRRQTFVIFLVMVVVLLGGGNLVAQTAVPLVLGDANGDKTVTIVDALITAQYAAGFSVGGFHAEAADVDGNKSINVVDSLLIAQYVSGLIAAFPASPPSHAIDPKYMVIKLTVINESIFPQAK